MNGTIGRMRLLPALVLILPTGCKTFTSVDEACHDKLGGEKHVSQDSAVEAMKRLNCYRRLVKVGRLRVDKPVQEVAEDHVDYMVNLESLDNYVPGTESSENIGFTGVDLNERLQRNDYQGDINGYARWELTPIRWHVNGADNVDYLFPDPWARQIYLQPVLIGGGMDEGQSNSVAEAEAGYVDRWSSYFTLLYHFPTNHPPVVYPRDGQVDIDPSYCDDIVGGALVEYGEIGYPITITMDANDISLISHSLQGPDGEVDTIVHLPGDMSWGFTLHGTIAITPLEPLQPSTEYTFNATVKYDGITHKVDNTYSTAAQNNRPTTFCGGGTTSLARSRVAASRTPIDPSALIDP